jgi:predicted transcriptional regulator
MTTKKRVLLSIHPEYANAILNGEKTFEYRRVVFKRNDIKEVVIYATSPISKVIGKFTIDKVYEDRPKSLWMQTKAKSGVSKEIFDFYFGDRPLGYAIKVSHPFRFAKPEPLSNYLSSNIPPQSFCYIQ